jgi:hypothetical protein
MWRKTCKFEVIVLVALHILYPYKNTDFTLLLRIDSLVFLDSFEELQMIKLMMENKASRIDSSSDILASDVTAKRYQLI